ncbi:unnamed protein product [Triticum turgidum subsp. durum]|uniref:Peptidase C1A papain C-terminal domain-containing protein n=1 Tax=Triticum turgidum subsp. durum TaxID=4567 RepID=A0A9R0RTF2_TRITD|nr:unnamed protein product [Triticum turgidum subsp. durum]
MAAAALFMLLAAAPAPASAVDFGEHDLASEDSLWALYERWREQHTNSWGPEWGEKGYIRMKRDVEDKEGLCGIAMEASYPVKTSANPKHAGAHDEL